MLPHGFVSLSKNCPGLVIAAAYATPENFTGSVVDGYQRVEAIFSEKGTRALCAIQAEAKQLGYGLKIFDAYRPVKAVKFFQAWAKTPEANPAKKELHYPTLTKQQLFEQGYIAERSSHSRGSALDLTLVDAQGTELDMGTIFDYFHEKSHTNSQLITEAQKKNRALLKGLMEKHGFKNYDQEWWHYSLVSEAFPGQSFDFDVF